MAAEGNPPGAIAQILADALVDAPADDEAADDGAEVDDDGQEEALHGEEPDEGEGAQRTAEENREIFGENRRRVAAGVLASLPGFSCVTTSAALAISGFAWWVYHEAYTAYEKFQVEGNSCDQPLAEWLLAAVLMLPLQVVCVIVYRKLRAMRPSRSSRRRRNALAVPRYMRCLGCTLRLWLVLVNPIFLLVGYNYTTSATDCDADLKHAVSEFITFEACVVAGSIIVVYCFAPAVLAAHANANGRVIAVAPRRHSRQGSAQPVRRIQTAQPGAIDRIETVPYSPELFFETCGDQEPPECCICQTEFDEDSLLKRTPCKHYFHESCLADWIGNYSKTCPLCRTDLDIQDDATG